MLVENGCSSVTASVRKLFRSDQRPASALPAPRAGLLAITAHRGFSRANGASESAPRRVLNCRFRASPLSLQQFDTNGGKRRPTRRAAPPFALPAPRRPPVRSALKPRGLDGKRPEGELELTAPAALRYPAAP